MTADRLDAWCSRWLDAGVGAVLLAEGHLSSAVGARLADGPEVVTKVRPAAARLMPAHE